MNELLLICKWTAQPGPLHLPPPGQVVHLNHKCRSGGNIFTWTLPPYPGHRQTCPLVLRAVLRKPLTLLFSFRIDGRANPVPSGGRRCSKIPARFVGAKIHPPETVDGADALILSTLATASAYMISCPSYPNLCYNRSYYGHPAKLGDETRFRSRLQRYIHEARAV